MSDQIRSKSRCKQTRQACARSWTIEQHKAEQLRGAQAKKEVITI
jgi:hypothetical protein